MDVSKHLERAAEAARKKNFDYAVSLLHQVLLLEPDHGEARAELRRVLARRAEYRKLPPFLAFLQGVPHRVALWIGQLAKKPDQVVRAAELCLVHNPYDRAANRALAEALERAGHLDSAVAVWEFLGDDEVLGDEALKRAGSLHYRRKRMQEALACYEKVLERSPRDSEAEKMRKNLAAEGVLSSGSYDPGRSSRDLARDPDQVRELEIARKVVTTEEEAALLRRRLEQAVAERPEDRRARRALIDHLVKTRSFDDAIVRLEEACEKEPDLIEWRDRLGDVRILKIEHEIRETRARAEGGDAAARTDLVDLEREKRELEIAEVSRRVAEHPTDLELRYRLGRLLLTDGRLEEAIAAFQHAIKDPRRRVDALLGLAHAFARQGLCDLARKQLDQALSETDPGSDRATAIVYEIGVLAQDAGELEEARRRFESIYEKDIHYRDVARRLEALAEAGSADARSSAEAGRRPAPTETSEERRAGADAREQGAEEEPPGAELYDFKD